MPPSANTHDWLPDHQLDAVMTLGHADAVAGRLCDLLFDHTQEPFTLGNVFDEDLCHVTVTEVAPLPPAIARLAADVLTQLRAAIEHAIYAEVEHGLQRKLTAEGGRRIEMPAVTTSADFDGWLKGRKRKELVPLRDGSDLVKRMRSLQPYNDANPEEHPLRVLAEHTNLAKHRTPAVAAVQLGQVATWPPNNPNVVTMAGGTPLEVGLVVATGPRYPQIELNVWPQVSIHRPHTIEWKLLVQEIGQLAEWVRTVAIPTIVSGNAGAEPPIPPQIDTTRGWANERDALQAGGAHPAHERLANRLQFQTLRRDLPEIIATHPEKPDLTSLQRWVDGLTDEQVMTQYSLLLLPDPYAKIAALKRMIRSAEEVRGRTDGVEREPENREEPGTDGRSPSLDRQP